VSVPLAIGLVGLAAVAPLISWRRVTRANLRRNLAWPAAFAAVLTVGLVIAGVGDRPLALAMFGCAALLLAGVVQEFWRGARARRAMSADSWPGAVLSLVRRNRRRYGGYLVHVGMATLFVGVAASSAFQKANDVRLKPGESATVGGYEITYAKPVARVEERDGRIERITLGARVDVAKDGEHVRTLEPTKGWYPSSAPFAPVSGMFDGESTSEVRMVAGLRKDVWTAVAPEIGPLRTDMKFYDRAIRKMAADGKPVDEQVLAFRYGLEKIVADYASGAPAATFRMIVSPMVAWIWIGAIIVFGGGLISLWPAPDMARRRAGARYAARVAQELGRA
jgi:cytochrome c-type biogenesis protein CcmF